MLLPLLTLALNAVSTGAVFLLCARYSMCSRAQTTHAGGEAGTLGEHMLASGAEGGAEGGGGGGGGEIHGNGADAAVAVHWRWVLAIWVVVVLASWTLVGFMDAAGSNEVAAISDLGEAYGVTSTVLTCVQYLPQLYTTFRLKAAGSFSLLTLAIQAPGPLGWAFYLVFASSSKVTTWMPPMVTGGMQVALFIMCMFYERRRKGQEGETVKGKR